VLGIRVNLQRAGLAVHPENSIACGRVRGRQCVEGCVGVGERVCGSRWKGVWECVEG
jgi:hypothetical protein